VVAPKFDWIDCEDADLNGKRTAVEWTLNMVSNHILYLHSVKAHN